MNKSKLEAEVGLKRKIRTVVVTQVEKPLTAYSENLSSDPVRSRCLSRTNVAKVDMTDSYVGYVARLFAFS